MRSDTSAPLGVPHVALMDTTLDGFQIPKVILGLILPKLEKCFLFLAFYEDSDADPL